MRNSVISDTQDKDWTRAPLRCANSYSFVQEIKVHRAENGSEMAGPRLARPAVMSVRPRGRDE